MKISQIEKALKTDGKKERIRGWVYRIRKMSGKVFIVVRDVTGIMQCVVADEKLIPKAENITFESSLEVEGTVKKDERAPGGAEMQVTDIKVHQIAERFPITKDQSTEFLMDVRHLSLRKRDMTAILKIRSTALFALHEYIRSQGYYEVDPPMLSGAASEGGAEVFELDYFDTKAYLTQSWQFYAENLIHAVEKVYGMNPAFRAEKSNTNRHVTEFWMFEVEAAWADLEEMIKISEGCLCHVAKKILEKNKPELEVLGLDPKKLEKIKAPFPRITYKEAIEILHKNGSKIPYGVDFGAAEEKMLAADYEIPLIVTNYPSEIMAFYKKDNEEDPKVSNNFNMLAPNVGEILDSSEREPDIEKIKSKLKKAGKNLNEVDWYLDSRRYGSVPHAGFGLGVARMLQWMLERDHIRDVIPFPRFPNRVKP
ncbi:MAG: asparagine--tRNA ligase [Candidatus Diapherotrites archaeon]|nr:asparagine--tRNA ligase [Candidatus Diapherotrites archaeon]